MGQDEQEDTTVYKVVVNHEEQYSIWPSYRENPLGWQDAGKTGLKEDCLSYIKDVWTDMRPLSLRKWMAEQAEQGRRTRRRPHADGGGSAAMDRHLPSR
jgi:MbtH protein